MSRNTQDESFLKRKPQTTESAIENSFGAPRTFHTFFENDVDHKRRAKQLRDEKRRRRKGN